MTTPRKKLVDAEQPMHYHLISRCVRRAFLYGVDPVSGKDYSHRKAWVEQRLFRLVKCFAVELNGYAIMSNHFHLVVYYDPKACAAWSDEDVIERWFHAFPSSKRRVNQDKHLNAERERMRNTPERLAYARQKLGSLSHFMKHLKQPIAWRANQEDGVSGHHFEKRFYSGALLSERSLLTAMLYVDLNPVRAHIANDISQCHNTSIEKRLAELENTPQRIDEYLAPLASGIDPRTDAGTDSTQQPRSENPRHHARQVTATLRQHCELLRSLIAAERHPHLGSSPQTQQWLLDLDAMRKPQRAYGPLEALQKWTDERQFKMVESTIG